MTAPTEPAYRGPDACAASGATYRQLDYWDRTGLVVPSVRRAGGSGTQRLYSRSDVIRLAVVRRLLDAGITLPCIRQHLDACLAMSTYPAADGHGTLHVGADHVRVTVDVRGIAARLPGPPSLRPSAGDGPTPRLVLVSGSTRA